MNVAVPVPFASWVQTRAEVLAWLVATNNWRAGAEIGCKDATTTAALLSLRPGLRMITVDPWIPQPENDGPEDWTGWRHERIERTARAKLIGYARRCRIIKAKSVEAAQRVEDASLDFVFLDGDHGTKAVLADIEAWRPKLRPGGWFTGHDVDWPTVRAAIDAELPGYATGPDQTWFRAA